MYHVPNRSKSGESAWPGYLCVSFKTDSFFIAWQKFWSCVSLEHKVVADENEAKRK